LIIGASLQRLVSREGLWRFVCCRTFGSRGQRVTNPLSLPLIKLNDDAFDVAGDDEHHGEEDEGDEGGEEDTVA